MINSCLCLYIYNKNQSNMLLLEQKVDECHVCYFDSSNIIACKYKRETNQLAIIFNGGTQYVYEKIIPYTFQRFKVAESQGTAFNRFIKNKFDFQKVVENMDLTEFKGIIESLKKDKSKL